VDFAVYWPNAAATAVNGGNRDIEVITFILFNVFVLYDFHFWRPNTFDKCVIYYTLAQQLQRGSVPLLTPNTSLPDTCDLSLTQ